MVTFDSKGVTSNRLLQDNCTGSTKDFKRQTEKRDADERERGIKRERETERDRDEREREKKERKKEQKDSLK